MQGQSVVTLPFTASSNKHSRMYTLQTVRQFGFDPQLLRSGVVVLDNQAPSDTATFFVRGAPTVIEQLVDKGTLPADFRQVGCRGGVLWGRLLKWGVVGKGVSNVGWVFSGWVCCRSAEIDHVH